MIFFETNKFKMFLLLILVVSFTGFILYQWIQFEPFQVVQINDQDNQMWNDIGNRLKTDMTEVQDNFTVVKYEFNDLQAELVKQEKQAKLVNEVKEYIDSLSTSTEENIN